jgi:hypothetical protein
MKWRRSPKKNAIAAASPNDTKGSDLDLRADAEGAADVIIVLSSAWSRNQANE